MDTDVSSLRLNSELVRIPSKVDVPSALVKQIEFYFSDVNLASDKYLLGQVQSNPQGYVSIKLISQFKRVKALTMEVDVIIQALRSSAELELDEENQQIRRKKPLVQVDTTDIQRRTVIVELLPGTPTIDSVTDIFSTFGAVNLVRICPPGSTDKLPAWLTEAEDINYSDNLFALVEYTEVDSTIKAVDFYAADKGLLVRHLVRKFRTGQLALNDDTDEELLMRRKSRQEGLRSGSKTSRRPRRKSERGSETESPIGSLDTPTQRRAGSFSSAGSYRRSPSSGANRANWRGDGDDSPPDSARSHSHRSPGAGSYYSGNPRSASYTNGDTPRRPSSTTSPSTPHSRLGPGTPLSGGLPPPSSASRGNTPRTPRTPLSSITLPGAGGSPGITTASPVVTPVAAQEEESFAIVSQDLDISMLHGSPPQSSSPQRPFQRTAAASPGASSAFFSAAAGTPPAPRPPQPRPSPAAAAASAFADSSFSPPPSGARAAAASNDPPQEQAGEDLDTMLNQLPALRISSRIREGSFTPTLATIPSISANDETMLAAIVAAVAAEKGGVTPGSAGAVGRPPEGGGRQRRNSWQMGDDNSPLPPRAPAPTPLHAAGTPPHSAGQPPRPRSRNVSNDGQATPSPRPPSSTNSAAGTDDDEEGRTPSGTGKRRTRRGGRKKPHAIEALRAEERSGCLSEGTVGTTPTGVHTPTEAPLRMRRASYTEGVGTRSPLAAVLAQHSKRDGEDSSSHSNEDEAKGGDWSKKTKGKKDYASWAAATPDFRALSASATKYSRTASAPGAPASHSPLAGPRMPDGTKGFAMGRGRLLTPPVMGSP